MRMTQESRHVGRTDVLIQLISQSERIGNEKQGIKMTEN